MVAFNKVQPFVENLAEGRINLGADPLKVVFTNTIPDVTDQFLSDIAGELATAFGYTQGGLPVTVASSGQVSGTYKLVLDDLIFTAAGGSVGPFRYFVLVDYTLDSPLEAYVVGWWDYGSAITLLDTESVTVDFSASNGAVQVT